MSAKQATYAPLKATSFDTEVKDGTDTDEYNHDIEEDEEEEEEEEEMAMIKKQKTVTFIQQKNEAWINFDIDLTEIDTKNQTFSIHARINVFWVDTEFVNAAFKQKVNDPDDCKDNKQYPWQPENKYIHSYLYDDFINDFGSYRLPLNVNKLFCNTLETIKEPKEDWRIWINPQTEDLHIYLAFKGKLIEHLECDDFPFDAQFLNMQLFYDGRNYNFTADCPHYVYLASNFDYQLPIKVKKFSSIVQWKLLSPWIDLSASKKYFNEGGAAKFDFGLIKLRVRRDPNYYLLYTVFPLTLIILTSFAVSSISPDDVGDRLGYLVTLLLTIAAFQYAISAELPESPTLTNVDKFILSGYLIECLFILYVAISATLTEYEGVDHMIELVLPLILGFLWLICNLLYVVYPYCKYKKGVDWKKMCDEEYHEFDTQNKENANVKCMEINDIFLGSENGGEITEKKKLTCSYKDEWMNGHRFLQIKKIQNNEYETYKGKLDEYKENKDKYKGQIVEKPFQKEIIVTTETKRQNITTTN